MTTALTPADIKIGRVYSAKRPQTCGLVTALLNDRQVLHIDSLGLMVQYDSPTVRDGRHYPRVGIDAFLRWASEDVTDKMPPNGDWRRMP